MNDDVMVRVMVIEAAYDLQEILYPIVCDPIVMAVFAHFAKVKVHSDGPYCVDARTVLRRVYDPNGSR